MNESQTSETEDKIYENILEGMRVLEEANVPKPYKIRLSLKTFDIINKNVSRYVKKGENEWLTLFGMRLIRDDYPYLPDEVAFVIMRDGDEY